MPLNHTADVGLSSENLYTGIKELAEYFGQVDSLEEDLLLVAAGIFAADRAMVRGERESFHREFDVTFALAHPERFERAKGRLETVLHLLTHDSWRLRFEADSFASRERVARWPEPGAGATLLFSGGIDSLAAAIERLGTPPLQLVSHHTRNQRTRTAQTNLAQNLRTLGFEGQHRSFFVSSRDRAGLVGHGEEGSQRTRSFVFLVLGALAALHEGHGELLWMAENGILAIHLPLSSARIGAFSTHTAHPQVVAEIEAFLENVLDRGLTISNPFLYRTKGEVAGIVAGRNSDLLFQSESCWMNARLPPGVSHCGECIPCLHRHIAVEQHVTDRTGYRRRVWEEDIGRLSFEDEGRRNVAELAELVVGMRDYDDETAMATCIELVNPYFDFGPALEMHRRFAREALEVLGRYPAVARLLA
jgi:hypothetical protein